MGSVKHSRDFRWNPTVVYQVGNHNLKRKEFLGLDLLSNEVALRTKYFMEEEKKST